MLLIRTLLLPLAMCSMTGTTASHCEEVSSANESEGQQTTDNVETSNVQDSSSVAVVPPEFSYASKGNAHRGKSVKKSSSSSSSSSSASSTSSDEESRRLPARSDAKTVKLTKHDEKLLRAARDGEFERVQQLLLVEGINVSAKGKRGMTPLHYAVEHGDLEMVKLLVEHHALVNAREKSLDTPLHYAAAGGHSEIVQFLVENNAAIDAKCRLGLTPLLLAAKQGSFETVQFLVGHGANANMRDCEERTLLHHAVDKGSLELIEFILETGVDINAKNCNDYTPLYFASKVGSFALIEFLVIRGANVNVKGKNTLDTPLHVAAKRGDLELVKLFLENDADINAKDSNGMTPLYFASKVGSFEIIEFLVIHGANVNMECKHTLETLLHMAAKRGDLELAKFFLENGADINAKDAGGKTPLDFAAERGNTILVNYIRRRPIDSEIFFQVPLTQFSGMDVNEKKAFGNQMMRNPNFMSAAFQTMMSDSELMTTIVTTSSALRSLTASCEFLLLTMAMNAKPRSVQYFSRSVLLAEERRVFDQVMHDPATIGSAFKIMTSKQKAMSEMIAKSELFSQLDSDTRKRMAFPDFLLDVMMLYASVHGARRGEKETLTESNKVDSNDFSDYKNYCLIQ